MKLVIAPAAKEDLLEIKVYISVKFCNPIAAVNVVKKIIKDYKMLPDTPEITDTGYRVPLRNAGACLESISVDDTANPVFHNIKCAPGGIRGHE